MWILVGLVVICTSLFFVVPALNSGPVEPRSSLADSSMPTIVNSGAVSASAGSELSGERALPAPKPELHTPPMPAEEPAGASIEAPAEQPVGEEAELLAMAVVIAEEYGKGPVDLDSLDLDAVYQSQVFTVAAGSLDVYVKLVKQAEEFGLRGYQRAFIKESTPFMVAAPMAAGILASKGDVRGGLLVIEAMSAVKDEFETY